MPRCVTHHHGCSCREAKVAELLAAAKAYFDGYCVDEADDYFDDGERVGENTGVTLDEHKAANRLRDAINGMTPNAGNNRRSP